jgi:hypothetical protein
VGSLANRSRLTELTPLLQARDVRLLPVHALESEGVNEIPAALAGGEKSLGSASNALPGRKLVTSKSPRMLKPFEIDLLRQDLKAALARLRAARSR